MFQQNSLKIVGSLRKFSVKTKRLYAEDFFGTLLDKDIKKLIVRRTMNFGIIELTGSLSQYASGSELVRLSWPLWTVSPSKMKIISLPCGSFGELSNSFCTAWNCVRHKVRESLTLSCASNNTREKKKKKRDRRREKGRMKRGTLLYSPSKG